MGDIYFNTGNICWKFYHKLEVSRGKTKAVIRNCTNTQA